MSFQMHEKCKCVNLCGGSEFIGNQGVQLEKLQWFEGVQLERLQWFEGVQLFIISFHTYIYIIPNRYTNL